MPDWTMQPEAAGPQGESDLADGYVTSDPRRADPALAAMERCRAAERAADSGKTVPA